jgi:hypothetical protein
MEIGLFSSLRHRSTVYLLINIKIINFMQSQLIKHRANAQLAQIHGFIIFINQQRC